MTRKFAVVLLATLAALAVAVAAMAAAPAGEIEIGKAAGVAAGTKGQVKFTHEKHADVKCVECHHEAKDAAAEAAIKGCLTCHGKDPAAKGDITAKNKDNPFHKNCIPCHKEKAKGPAKCKECHGGADE